MIGYFFIIGGENFSIDMLGWSEERDGGIFISEFFEICKRNNLLYKKNKLTLPGGVKVVASRNN